MVSGETTLVKAASWSQFTVNIEQKLYEISLFCLMLLQKKNVKVSLIEF